MKNSPHWIEVSLRVDGESAEAVAEVLSRYGHQGIALEQDGIPPDTWDEGDVPAAQYLILRAYLPDDAELALRKSQLEAALGHMRLLYPMPAPQYRRLPETDWAEAWKAHYKPLRVGERLLIRPLWLQQELAAGDIEIALDPGMAFGTGSHPSTQLCLQALERRLQPGQDVLDLGTGSGILAIAAAKLGARQILALDTDRIALQACHENARANGVVPQIKTQHGSLEAAQARQQHYHLLLVNILAPIIVEMLEQGLGNLLYPNAIAIFSGIIDSQEETVTQALQRAGLQQMERQQQGDWLMLAARRPEPALP